MLLAESDHIAEKFKEILVLMKQIPVQPRDRIVLTIGIVISESCIAEFIAGEEHGSPPAAHEYGTGILDHPETQCKDFRIVCISLHTTVPAVVVVISVRVIPAVCFIVFLVIAVQVIERESVVAGQEVDGSIAAAVDRIIQIRGTGHSLCGDPRHLAVPLQETPHIIPVASVPFRPAFPGRERTHLIESAGIPGLGNELDISKDRIEGQTPQQRRLIQGSAVITAPEDGRQIEPETVHPVVRHPVAETVEDQLLNDRVITVQRISAATEVIVFPVRGEHIVDIVVKSFETERRPHFISFGRMVEHNVQDHVDLIVVQRLDQTFQLHSLTIIFNAGGVACIRGKEADRIIAPVVEKFIIIDQACITHLVKFKDRHQLHRIDPQPFQIRNLFFQPFKRARTGYAGGGRFGKSADMELIDYQIFHRDRLTSFQAPVKVVLYDPRTVAVMGIILASPLALSGDCAGIGIQQDFRLVEPQPFFLVIGTVQPVGIFEFFDIQSEYDHGIDKADLVIIGKFQSSKRLFCIAVEEQKFTGRCSMRLDRKIDAARDHGGSEEPEESGADLKAGDRIQWL